MCFYELFQTAFAFKNFMEQQSLEKSEAQVPMQYSKINDKPFPPSTDYVFSKSKMEINYVRAKHISLKNFRGFIMMKSIFSVFFFFFLILFYFIFLFLE